MALLIGVIRLSDTRRKYGEKKIAERLQRIRITKDLNLLFLLWIPLIVPPKVPSQKRFEGTQEMFSMSRHEMMGLVV